MAKEKKEDELETTPPVVAKIDDKVSKTPPGTPAATPDIVDDANSGEIRKLQGKLATLETTNKTLQASITETQELLRKAGETKLAAATPTKQNETVLDYLNNLIFKPKAK